MISAETRALLSDALTPPPGYRFDCGIATTYSLDPVSLLAMPLHMAWLASGNDAPDRLDPLRTIEALRRIADRFTVFCERGRLQLPRSPSPLLTLLEGMIHEVVAPHGGAFHPKVWFLRFVPEDGAGDTALRLLVLSRNLTNDASWDLCVRLDGQPGSRQTEEGRKLAKFIEGIADEDVCRKPLPASRRSDIDTLIHDARRADWDLPGHFEQVDFHVLGLGKRPVKWMPSPPGDKWQEFGVISPFVSEGALQELAGQCRHPLFLVSRAEELDCLSQPIPGGFGSIMVLNDAAEEEEAEQRADQLSGLHAKAFIGRAGWDTHQFLGSANATNAALIGGHNVEFMVELVGRHSKVGMPDAWVSGEGLGPLLMEYRHCEANETDAQAREDEQTLKDVHQELARQALRLRCRQPSADWEMVLENLRVPECDGLTLSIWPLTWPAGRAIKPGQNGADDGVVVFTGLAKHDVTSLLGFRLQLRDADLGFGLDVPLIDPPANRDVEVLRTAIQNRDGFIRYLMLLLGETDEGGGVLRTGVGSLGNGSGGISTFEGLFEKMAKTYAREPEKLKHIESVMARLGQPGSDRDSGVLPEDFQDLWSVFALALSGEDKP